MASIAERRVERDSPLSRNAPLVAAAIATIGILLVHADTVASIVAIWWRSETFAHGFVVVPIALWLAWRKRVEIASVPARPWYPALLLVALMGALWLASVAAEAIGIRQFALAFMVQAAIVAVVGLGVARSAAFPLLFLLFAVPAGEFLLPILIDWTADFTVWALRATGVPVFREANHFVIPSGNWSVVEACSGLRYLIASLMIGVVYAAVSYRSLGVDHIIYGWIFFGVVMALLFWVGSFWAEPDAPRPATARTAASTAAGAPSTRYFVTAVAAIVLSVVWRPFAIGAAPAPSAVKPELPALSVVGGWAPATYPDIGWTPGFLGEAARLRQGFVRSGSVAGLQVFYYRNQVKGRELVTSGNHLVLPKEFRWREVDYRPAAVRFDGVEVEARRTLIADPRQNRLVAYSLYWVDGTLTSSDYVAKARLAWSRLTGGSGDAALVVFFAPDQEGSDPAREALEALSPAVADMLEAARAKR